MERMNMVFVIHWSAEVRKRLCEIVAEEGCHLVGVASANNGALNRIEHTLKALRPEILVVELPIDDPNVVKEITGYCPRVKFVSIPPVYINDLDVSFRGEEFRTSLRSAIEAL
jgi:hypothetical protein